MLSRLLWIVLSANGKNAPNERKEEKFLEKQGYPQQPIPIPMYVRKAAKEVPRDGQ